MNTYLFNKAVLPWEFSRKCRRGQVQVNLHSLEHQPVERAKTKAAMLSLTFVTLFTESGGPCVRTSPRQHFYLGNPSEYYKRSTSREATLQPISAAVPT